MNNQRNWGCGLCFLYLRNVKDFKWNRKRVDRIYREGLGIEVDFSLPSERVIRALDRIIEWRGKPNAIRCDNGPDQNRNLPLPLNLYF